MTEGTSQGLFIVVAIVIFGIFVFLANTLFGSEGLTSDLKMLFENATEQARVNLTGDIIDSYEDSLFTYNLNVGDNTAAITGFVEGVALTELVIPSKVVKDDVEYTVSTIGSGAFEGRNLVSVFLPESISTIGKTAFKGNLLTSVDIPDSVTTIGYEAFRNNNLSKVLFGESVENIEPLAFYSNFLKDINLPESLKTIGNHAFAFNDILEVIIPDSVTKISLHAFGYNHNLIHAELPKDYIYVGDEFWNYTTVTHRNK